MADPTGTNTSTGITGVAGGDLSGSFPNPTVVKINGSTPGALATAVVGQIPGTATNDSASAGNVGEYLIASIASSAALVLSTGVGTSICSAALSAGDWNVWGQAYFHPGASITVITAMVAAISTVAGSTAGGFPGITSGAQAQIGLGAGLTSGADSSVPVGATRISLSTAATAFLNSSLTFATSTASGYGVMQARRVR